MDSYSLLAAAQASGPLVLAFVFPILVLLILLTVLVCGIWALRSAR